MASKEKDEKKKLKNYTERLWTTDDEIAILKGSLDFKIGNDVDIKMLYEQRKESLQLNATYDQVRHKIRKLRDKYRSNVEKLDTGIKPKFIFSKLHQHTLFYLSEKVWGSSSHKDTLEHALGDLFGNQDAVKRAMKLVDKSKNEDLERRWKALKDEEMNLYLKHMELINETMEACKASTSTA